MSSLTLRVTIDGANPSHAPNTAIEDVAGMPRCLILAQSDVTARTLEVWRDLLGYREAFGAESCPDAIVHDAGSLPAEAGTLAYDSLVERIESIAKGDAAATPINHAVVMVDTVRPSGLSAVDESGSWDNLIALLILTFPEIKWIFGVFLGKVSTPENGVLFPADDHNLLSLLTEPRRDPLFDPTGLREWVRQCTNEALEILNQGRTAQPIKAALRLARRRQMAAAIDEEIDYALMHGYAAYRYGFRADAITSWSLMDARFGKVAKEKSGLHGYDLLLEDMRLVFPDKPARTQLSNLATGRAIHCPLLNDDRDKSTWRFLITTGQEQSNSDLVAENESYLYNKQHGRGAVLYKPIGGVADLWRKAGLYDDLYEADRSGNAHGFDWPPAEIWDELCDGHGSPGKLGLVAATLIRRTTELRKEADSPSEFIRCALLAMDATEYLGGKTPTLTLAALIVKYECEVRAECAFVGAGYHFILKKRFQELYQEIKCITRWFHRAVRTQSARDAQATVLNRLILAYREAGQIEEEHACMVELRGVNRRMNRPRSWNFVNPLAWFVHGILAYGEWLLVSFNRILMTMMFWIVVIAGTSWTIDSVRPELPVDSIGSTLSWMFGGSADPAKTLELAFLSWFAIVVGAFHVGIVISYLYSLIARK